MKIFKVILGILILVTLAFVFVQPASANGTKEISAKALDDHECDDSEWHFVITQIDEESNAPASIFVQWANGASEVVPLDNFTGGVAHYTTTSNLDSTVVSATAEIYEEWDGQFNLSHGPCIESETPTPTETETEEETPTPTETQPGDPTQTPTPPHHRPTKTPTPPSIPPSGGGNFVGDLVIGLLLVFLGLSILGWFLHKRTRL